jgi:hypothetical protein
MVPMHESQDDARDERVEARVRSEVQGFVQGQVRPGAPLEIDHQANHQGEQPDGRQEAHARAKRAQSVEHEEQKRHQQVELLFEGQRPTPEHHDVVAQQRHEVGGVDVLVR